MTDSHGRKVSFKNCVILMTSNVGVRFLKDFGTGVGFSTSSREEKRDEEMKSVLSRELKKKFPPEFINRLDEIVYFNELSKEDILRIIDLELEKTLKRAEDIGYTLIIEQSLKDHLIEVGYDKEFGARPLKRTIQKWVDDWVTEFIIENNPEIGSKLSLEYDAEGDATKISLKTEEKKGGRKKKG